MPLTSSVFVNNTITDNYSPDGNNETIGASLYFSEGSWVRIYDTISWKTTNDPLLLMTVIAIMEREFLYIIAI